MLQAGDYALLKHILRRQPVHANAFTGDDIARYKEALARPGARTAAVNYYRAARKGLLKASSHFPTVAAPTLLIWGEQDAALGIGLTEGLSRWVPNLRVARLAGASHWVQNDAPAEVNRLMLEFLTENGRAPV